MAVTERDREAANRLFFLCGSLGDFDAACAFLAEWREARMAESEAARLKAEGQPGRGAEDQASAFQAAGAVPEPAEEVEVG